MPKASTIAKTAAGTAAAAIAVVGAIAFAPQPNKSIKLCDDQQVCQTLTEQEYTDLKTNLAVGLREDRTFQWDEYRLLVQVLNYEIKKGEGGKTVISGDLSDPVVYRDKLAKILEN